jgi:SAM-dependent methyltransferase
MHHDVLALRDFYYTTSLGRAVQKALRDRLTGAWGDVRGLSVGGFGFAAPLLRPFLDPAARVIALMPGPQGVMPWPAEGANRSVLVEETSWPLATDLLDRLVVLHGLETSERPAALLEEAARVLKVGGQAMFILPNRSGLWARNDATPFGLGRPYTLGQCEQLLGDHGFALEDHDAALFFPPRDTRRWLRWSMAIERTGRRVSRLHAGGVLMVHARRVSDTPRMSGLAVRDRKPLRILDGVAQPGLRPAWRKKDGQDQQRSG